MKKHIILLTLLILIPVSAFGWGMIGQMGSTSVGISLPVYEDFNRSDQELGSSPNWTEHNGDWEIVSNIAVKIDAAVWSNATYGTPISGLTGYAKITIKNITASSDRTCILFRATDASTEAYSMCYREDSTSLYWYRYDDLSSPATTVLAINSSLNFDSDDTMAITWIGTGTDTIIRVWRNPTNNLPSAVDDWDGGSDTADYTFTDDPSDAVDSGTLVGIIGYGGSSAVKIDDLYFGDTE